MAKNEELEGRTVKGQTERVLTSHTLAPEQLQTEKKTKISRIYWTETNRDEKKTWKT